MTLRKHDRINRNYAASRTRCLRSELLECRNLLSVSPVQTAAEEVSPTAFFSFDAETIDGGTLYGGEIIEAGAVDKAISLDGVDDYFALEASEDLQIEGEITIAAWVKPESKTGVQDIIAHGYTRNPNAEVFLRISGGQYQIGSWNGSNHMISVNIPTSDIGSWVHLCGTYDGTHWRLYRNGELAGILEDSVGAVTVNADWTVGASMNGTDRFFHGVIDEVNIFDSAISEEMIADLAVRTADKPAGSWTALMDDDGLMYDSASDTTGQLRNGAEWAYDPEFGSVLDLTGNNGSVLLGNPESLQIEGKITLAAWVKPESTDGYNYILAKGFSQSPNGEICLRINDGKYEVGSWNGTSYYAAFDVPEEDLGTWVYLCGTYDGEYWRLYRNGEEVAALQSTVGAISVNSDWSIGSTGNGTQRFFNGQIKQVQLYDTAVTPAQIADMYAAAPVPEVQSAKTGKFAPIEFGGEVTTQVGSEYTLYFNANGYEKVSLLVDWGEGEESVVVEGESGIFTCSHIYSTAGVRQIRVTNVVAKYGDTERHIDVYGDLDHEVTVEDPVIYNGDFNIMPDELRQKVETYGWWIDTLPGWSGEVEVRDGFVELDGDQMQPEGKDQYYTGELCTITSAPISMIEDNLYRLSFTTGNRSDFAEDNIVKVTIPGEILYINNIPKNEFLDMISSADNQHGANSPQNPYCLVSVGDNEISFSAGGGKYGTQDDPTLGEEGYKISSVIFAADSSLGSVSFEDYSIDRISSYGPFLYDVSMDPITASANLTMDSTNRNSQNYFERIYLNDHIENDPDLPGCVIEVGKSEEMLFEITIDNVLLDEAWIRLKYIPGNSKEEVPAFILPLIDGDLENMVCVYPTEEVGGQTTINFSNVLLAEKLSKNSTGYVELELYIPQTTQTPEKVLSSDIVKVTSTLFVMGDHTDYGQLLKPELNTNFMWDCDLANNKYITPNSGGKRYKDGKEVTQGGTGESYLESALSYNNGFTMDFSYAFDRNRGNNGYVQADVPDKKLSFVANGGVKFGSKGGASSGVFEAAILDVEAMAEILRALPVNGTSTNEIWNFATIEDDFLVPISKYKKEKINRLMNGVGYGKEFESILPGYPMDGENDRKRWLFEKNLELSTVPGQMTIEADAVTKTDYGIIEIITNDILTYSSAGEILSLPPDVTEDNVVKEKGFNGKIYLQAHWGSGVIYQNVSIESKESSTQGEEA